LLVDLDGKAKRGKEIDAWTGLEVNWLDEIYDLVDRFPRANDDKEVLNGGVRLTSLEATTLPPPPASATTSRPPRWQPPRHGRSPGWSSRG